MLGYATELPESFFRMFPNLLNLVIYSQFEKLLYWSENNWMTFLSKA
jgi:hypothetical protein